MTGQTSNKNHLNTRLMILVLVLFVLLSFSAQPVAASFISEDSFNEQPVFISPPTVNAIQGSPYTYTVYTADPDGYDTLAISAPLMPDWLTLTDNGDGTALLSGTPTNANVGTPTITLRVTDALGAFAEQIFTLTVENVNDAPTFTSTPVLQVAQDVTYTYAITVADIDTHDTLSVEVVSTLPYWLKFTGNADGTATLSGTPQNEDAGQYHVVLQVKDRAGAADVQDFMITVTNVNDLPSFLTPPTVNGIQGQLYTYQVLALDPDAGDTVQLSAPVLPTWLTFVDLGNGSGLLSGTPSIADTGDNSVTLQATDASGAQSNQIFTISVESVNNAPVITSSPAMHYIFLPISLR